MTAAEAMRQPVCLLLAAACVVLTGLTPLLLMHSFGEEGKLARDSGLAFHLVFGLLIAGYTAFSSVAREIRAGTASAVLSKPVDRITFFAAKYAGALVVVGCFSLCACAATLLAERAAEHYHASGRVFGHVVDWRTGSMCVAAPFAAMAAAALLNYFRRRPFGSTAFWLLPAALALALLVSALFDRGGGFAPFDFRVQWRIASASLLVFMALAVLAALAVALSTRLGAAPTISLCGVVFLAGLVSDYLLGRRAESSAAAALLYRLVPNWQHFWLADALDRGGTIPGSYLASAAVYAACLSFGLICIGALSFRAVEMR